MDALWVGAAVLGVPAKATIKEVHISLCTCTIWDLIRLFTSLSYSS